MSGLWRNSEETREGKYPVLLRRDGTVPECEWFVMLQRDPHAIPALRAYADSAERAGLDPQYVADLRQMASDWESSPLPPGDPDAPRHRPDMPEVLTFPSSLAAFMAGHRLRERGRSA